METCFYEMGMNLCYIAKYSINKEIKILDLVNPEQSHSECEDLLKSLIFSSLMSKEISTNGHNKPAYIFSRFVADCVNLQNLMQ